MLALSIHPRALVGANITIEWGATPEICPVLRGRSWKKTPTATAVGVFSLTAKPMAGISAFLVRDGGCP